MKAHMDNFDEVIKEFAVPVVDKHGIVYYEMKVKRNIKNIDIKNPKSRKAPMKEYKPKDPSNYEYRPRGYIAYNSRALITPLGRFDSFKLAAAAHNLSEQALRNRLIRDKKGEYRYETDI